MGAFDREPIAGMVDLVHFRRVGERVGLGIENDRALFPALLPQLQADIDVLVGPVVAGIVGQDLAESLSFGIGQI